MKCDCKKDGNCKHQNAFDKGLSGILALHFGGHNPGWDVFEKAVKKYCQHRNGEAPPCPSPRRSLSKESIDALAKIEIVPGTIEDFKKAMDKKGLGKK